MNRSIVATYHVQEANTLTWCVTYSRMSSSLVTCEALKGHFLSHFKSRLSVFRLDTNPYFS